MKFQRMINAVDVHPDGLPGPVIVGGVGNVPGGTMLEKARWLESNNDALRKVMLNEPRGYPATCCNLVLPSNHPEADFGYCIPALADGGRVTIYVGRGRLHS